MIVDFREIEEWEGFEDFVEDLLCELGFKLQRSGTGADGGRDMLAEEEPQSILGSTTRRWLVECKHYAHSGKSVSPGDVGSVSDKCLAHSVDGYLLVTSTMASSGLQQILDAVNNNPSLKLKALCWRRNKLADLVIKNPHLFKKYFPKSFETHFGERVTVDERDLIRLFLELYDRRPDKDEIKSIMMHSIKFDVSDVEGIKLIVTDPEVNGMLKDVYNRLLSRDPDPTGLFVYGWWYKNLPAEKRLGFIEQSVKDSPEYNTPVEVEVPPDVIEEVRHRITNCLNCQARDSGEWIWVLGRESGTLSEMIDEVFEELHPEQFEKFIDRLYTYYLEDELACPYCGTPLDLESTVGTEDLD